MLFGWSEFDFRRCVSLSSVLSRMYLLWKLHWLPGYLNHFTEIHT